MTNGTTYDINELLRELYSYVSGVTMSGTTPYDSNEILRMINSVLEANPLGDWKQITAITGTPSGDYAITTTTDLSDTVKKGHAIKYTMSDSSVNYGVITNVSATTISFDGISTGRATITGLWYSETKARQISFAVKGEFATTDTTTLLKDQLGMDDGLNWGLSKAFLVRMRFGVASEDSGATQPRINVTNKGAVVCGDNTEAGVEISESSWQSSENIIADNYGVAPDNRIELTVDDNYVNGDATNLYIELILVME